MASSSLSVRILPEVLREVAFGSITGSFVAVGSALLHPGRIVMFQNTTDAALYISWNGIDSHLYLPAHGFVLLDIGTNKGMGSEFCIAQGTIFYVKYGSAPTLGELAISVFYGKPV